MTASAAEFVGTWRLLSMRAHFPDGRTEALYGEAPTGFITYTEQGHMHAIITDAERPRFGISAEEIGLRRGFGRALFLLGRLPILLGSFPRMMRAAGSTLRTIAYSGSWEVCGDEVVHHVQASAMPDWAGTDLVRAYRFEGDRLVLTAHHPGGSFVALVWGRG